MNMRTKRLWLACLAAVFAGLGGSGAERSLEKEPGDAVSRPVDRDKEPGLVGYWKLDGDCRDYSGHGNHGVNHGVNLDGGIFDGVRSYIEVPRQTNDSLKLG